MAATPPPRRRKQAVSLSTMPTTKPMSKRTASASLSTMPTTKPTSKRTASASLSTMPTTKSTSKRTASASAYTEASGFSPLRPLRRSLTAAPQVFQRGTLSHQRNSYSVGAPTLRRSDAAAENDGASTADVFRSSARRPSKYTARERLAATVEAEVDLDEVDDDFEPLAGAGIQVQGCVKKLDVKLLDSCGLSLAMHPVWQVIAIGRSDGRIELYHIEAQMSMGCLGKKKYGPVMSLKYIPNSDGKGGHLLAAAYGDSYVRFWDTDSKKVLREIKDGEKETYAIAFDRTCKTMATGGVDCNIRLYDVETGQCVNKLRRSWQTSDENMEAQEAAYTMRVFSIQFHPLNDDVLLSGGWDSTVHYWDKHLPHPFREVLGPHITGNSLHIKSNGSTFLAGSWRRRDALQEYDLDTGRLINSYDEVVTELNGDFCHIYSAHYMSKSQRVIAAAGSHENMMRLIDPREVQEDGVTSGMTIARVSNLDKSVYDVVSCAPSDVNRDTSERISQDEALLGLMTEAQLEKIMQSSVIKRGYLAMTSGHDFYLFSHNVG